VDVTGNFTVTIYRIDEEETFGLSGSLVPTYQTVQRHFWEINVILKISTSKKKVLSAFTS
jgi:hypothetical protein